jgi:hypothetical protein
VECSDITHRDEHDTARCAITVMLGQVNDQLRSADLGIPRKVRRKPMLPVGGETQIIEIELLGLRLVEDAEDRNGALEQHASRPARTQS